MILPSERLIKSLLSNTFQDENLSDIFEILQPRQRIVNIIFDEVKLKQVTRYSGGYIMDYAEYKSSELATSALVTELVCHYCGPIRPKARQDIASASYGVKVIEFTIP